MKILVTGGAGFVGSNLCVSFMEKYPGWKIIALDNLKRRGSELNINRLRNSGVDFIHGDIRNKEDLDFKGIDLILECSADPTVMSGYGGSPMDIISSNLFGTVNCLELARKNKSDFIFLSTSRVYAFDRLREIPYEELETRFKWKGKDVPGLTEKGVGVGFSVDGPRSMYGSTKLASEIIMQEYMNMYGIRGVIDRFGVIAGPWQFGKPDQGIFTHWLLSHHFKKPLNYIGFGGKGKQVRDLIHISDVFDLIDMQISGLEDISGGVYNVGGGENNLSLLETTKLCQKITGNTLDIGSEAETRPADIPLYITDNSKVTEDLGWKPRKRPEETLKDIHNWIAENEDSVKKSLIS